MSFLVIKNKLLFQVTMGVLWMILYLMIKQSVGAPEDFNYLCNSRSLIAGAGYSSHPKECDKYIQCLWDVNGNYVAEVRQCAFGTHWNIAFHTCLRSTETSCVVDECATKPDGTRREGTGNCRGYWECSSGKSVSKCCLQGQFYSQTYGCINNTGLINCTDRCFDDFNLRTQKEPVLSSINSLQENCDKKAISGNPTKYEQLLAGYSWKIVRPCSLGTQFVQSACNCVKSSVRGLNNAKKSNVHKITRLMVVNPDSAKSVAKSCKPSVYLPFTADRNDLSRNNIVVANENVVIENGQAKFNGVNSRLIIPEFSKLEPSGTLVIKIKYTSDYKNIPIDSERAIISNDNCHYKPSIILSENDNMIKASVGTWAQNLASTKIQQYPMTPGSIVPQKTLVYKFENGRLTIQSGNQTSTEAVIGHFRNINCPLHIGYADGLQSFKGTIDEIAIYFCDPDTSSRPKPMRV